MKWLYAVFLVLLFGCSGKRQKSASACWPVATWDCDCSTTMTTRFDGQFANKNEYVQNPRVTCRDSIERFIATRVVINDSIILPADSLNSSAFEIPLKNFGFKTGDPIHIVVEHYDCALPKLLHAEMR